MKRLHWVYAWLSLAGRAVNDECGDVVLAMVAKWKFLLLDSVNCIKCASTQEDLKKNTEGRNSAFSANIHQNIKQQQMTKKLITDNDLWMKLCIVFFSALS